MYADYTFYTESFYGAAITEADFPRLSSKASDFIDYYTRGKAAQAAEDEDVAEALSKCCCALAEAMQTDEQAKAVAAKINAAALSTTGGEIKSETVGSWSQSYTTAADYAGKSAAAAVKDANVSYANIALEYLANTGLLYRGGCCK